MLTDTSVPIGVHVVPTRVHRHAGVREGEGGGGRGRWDGRGKLGYTQHWCFSAAYHNPWHLSNGRKIRATAWKSWPIRSCMIRRRCEHMHLVLGMKIMDNVSICVCAKQVGGIASIISSKAPSFHSSHYHSIQATIISSKSPSFHPSHHHFIRATIISSKPPSFHSSAYYGYYVSLRSRLWTKLISQLSTRSSRLSKSEALYNLVMNFPFCANIQTSERELTSRSGCHEPRVTNHCRNHRNDDHEYNNTGQNTQPSCTSINVEQKHARGNCVIGQFDLLCSCAGIVVSQSFEMVVALAEGTAFLIQYNRRHTQQVAQPTQSDS